MGSVANHSAIQPFSSGHVRSAMILLVSGVIGNFQDMRQLPWLMKTDRWLWSLPTVRYA